MTRLRTLLVTSAVSSALVAVPLMHLAHAQWIVDGTVVCEAAGNQGSQVIATDGSGGAIVCWVDWRSGAGDIYVQRVSAAGIALWNTSGVAICSAPNEQHSPAIASDGLGGAIVVWADERTGALSDDIYAQRISASGQVEWEPNGVAICVATNAQYYPAITTDGGGGAITVWVDERAGSTSDDIYAQRVGFAGSVLWASNGIPLCTATHNQGELRCVGDGSGGAIATWSDLRNGNNLDIYAQRVSDAGLPLWTLNGVAACSVNRDQRRPTMASDGSGGAIIAWVDWRYEFESDVYAQRINGLGLSQWAAGGVAVCSTYADQGNAEIVSDDCGGAIVAWHDSGGNNLDILAQRVSSTGTLLWPINGVSVCDASDIQYLPAIVSDGACGAIITWEDLSQGFNATDVFAGRVDSSGMVVWGSNGVSIGTAVNNQSRPVIATDVSGGAVIAWNDERNGTSNSDIYARRISSIGTIPTAVRPSSGGLRLVVFPNVPNPFSLSTGIDVLLDGNSEVDVKVYDVAGRPVRALTKGPWSAGIHRVYFEGRDDSGRSLPSGVYFVRVVANGSQVTRKIVLER